MVTFRRRAASTLLLTNSSWRAVSAFHIPRSTVLAIRITLVGRRDGRTRSNANRFLDDFSTSVWRPEDEDSSSTAKGTSAFDALTARGPRNRMPTNDRLMESFPPASTSTYFSDNTDYFGNSAYSTTTNSVANEVFLCPISNVLPMDPVTAEDGITYERSAIEKIMKNQGRNFRSPVTDEKIGKKLIPAVFTKNAIEQLVRSGSVSGEIARRWKISIRDDEDLRIASLGAERGETLSMCRLGNWYSYGKKSLEKDKSRAYFWYRTAADYGCIRGMTYAGICLLTGEGVEINETEGLTLLGVAAQGGSDLAAYWLGVCYKEGKCGLPKNEAQAMIWFQKLVDKRARTGFVDAPFTHVRQLLSEVTAPSDER